MGMWDMSIDLQSLDIWEERRYGADTHTQLLEEILPEMGKQEPSMVLAVGSMMWGTELASLMKSEMNAVNLLGSDSVWDILWGTCAEHVVGYSLGRRQVEGEYVIGMDPGELQGRWILMQSGGGSSVDGRKSCVPGVVLARAPAP